VRKLRWGVIGIGWFGEEHAAALAGLPEVEVYSLCTRTRSRLDEVGAKFGVKRLHTDYNEMLADPELDVVSVTTMWDQHTGPTLAALAAGKHVFLEKPMASTVEDCRKIIEAERQAGKFLMVGHIVRFNPRHAVARREILAGKIGKIVSIYARRNVPVSVGAQVLPKIGPIVGDGVHDADIMLWFTGAKFVQAYAESLNVFGHKYPDVGWSIFRFDTGAIGVCENVWCMPDKKGYFPDERMEIIGTEGAIYLEETYPPMAVVNREGLVALDPTDLSGVASGRRGGLLAEELHYFARCVLKKRAPEYITPQESMDAVVACLAAERSATLGRPVRIDEMLESAVGG
jgi:UDP-N-acetylglucosamine 3-dehydrogenase